MILVLPAFNEAPNLPPLLDAVASVAAQETGHPLQVLVVDDGSKDATAQVSKQPRSVPVEVLAHPRNLGLAAAFRTGLLAAIERAGDDDVVVVMDADNSHRPEQIGELIAALDRGADVAIASRYRPGAQIRGVPQSRQLMSTGMSWLFRLVNPISGVRDYSCGYRAYRASLLKAAYRAQGERMFAQEGFACMVAMLLRLQEQGARFVEVPLDLRYDRKAGASKMKVGATVARTLLLLGRERLRHLPGLGR
ncbi:MAG: glycosyltransferase [Myxococcales bacterium]